MTVCKQLLKLSRILGRCSGILFLLALLAIGDGLYAMMRHDYNQVDVVAGESVLVTGSLPAGQRSIENLTVFITGGDDVTFRLLETFSGFWLGGNMWRGELIVPAGVEGKRTITVHDMWVDEKDGQRLERQNPMLVYPVHIWKDTAALNSSNHSLLLSRLQWSPFVTGAICVGSALLFAGAQWYVFRRAEYFLTPAGFCFVHGIRRTDEGVEALFASDRFLVKDMPVQLFTAFLEEAGTGRMHSGSGASCAAIFSFSSAPCYGWFIKPC